jgi:succinylarginine dihydrolase
MKPTSPTPIAVCDEVNFDGLVGPTHNYSGLSFGNVASIGSKAAPSNPREAALQGLSKMRALLDLGLKQGVLPPQERPDVWTLRKLGFTGTDRDILAQVAKEAPVFLSAVSSASSMWTANAATVSPSADSTDGRVHFTPANLNSKFHRAIEPETTARSLRAIFRDPARFAHHDPLPAGAYFGDEGAANHTRLCAEHGSPGLELFIYGRRGFPGPGVPAPEPLRFPARQTLEASQAVARLHGLRLDRTVFWQQNPEAIDAGVFHNDVAGVGNRNALFYHEQAYLDSPRLMAELKNRFEALSGGAPLATIEVPASEVPIAEAVRSYLFNSQLVSLPNGEMALIAPHDCEESKPVKKYIESLLADSSQPIRKCLFFDLKQSMRNGGGPACLRLRVVLNKAEILGTNPQALLTPGLYDQLTDWVKRRYRDRLEAGDLTDPALLDETRAALDELTQILDLGSIYPFQLATS